MENHRIGFWDIVQTLAAYVAVPVALLYPVGLFALFAQFMNYYFLDVYTAWYAASLVNRMLAIEQGVTILALALVASVILAAIISQIVSGFERRGASYAKLIGISLLTLFLYCAYSRIVAQGDLSLLALRGRLSTECNEDMVVRHQLELWPDSLVPASIFLVGCLWGGWLINRSYQAYRRRSSANQSPFPAERRLGNAFFEGVTEGWILSGLSIAYTFSVIASIVLAWHTPSFVPYMTYGPTVEHRAEPGEPKKPTENAFLSHTEGQWYFLHRIPKEDTDDDPKTWKPPDYTIVSLREGAVKYVRVRPNPPNASRVAPFLGVLGEKPPEEHPCKEGDK